MSPQEFAQRIKAKYPDYQAIDDGTLVQRFIEKYPEYSQIVQFTPESQPSAAPLSPLNFAQAPAAQSNPVNYGSPGVPPNVSQFAQQYEPYARQVQEQYGVPPLVTLGQAALETGFGTSNFARERNNFFGMNAIDSDPNQAYGYSDPGASFMDYGRLISQEPRYAQAYAQREDPYAMLAGIRQAGYATDPNYIQKVHSIMQQLEAAGLR